MADDVNKKITIDVEVTTDGQQQINQYTTAFNNLRSTISNLGKPLSDISTSIQSLDKDLAGLTDSVNKLNAQNQLLSTSGNKIKDSVLDLASAYKVWDKTITFVKAGVISLEDALTGGLAILTVFGPTNNKMGRKFIHCR